MADERVLALEEIRQGILNLSESSLYEFRVQQNYSPVIGEGSVHAKIMFIGEAPGEKEAKSGRPFIGASGKLLDELLATIGLERSAVYITNIVKDRPPENRDPRKEEIRLYAPFLERQIAIIQPQVFATLGRFSMEYLLTLFDSPQKKEKISHLHGQVLDVQTSYGSAKLVPLFHPAVALYAVGQKDMLKADFQALKQFI